MRKLFGGGDRQGGARGGGSERTVRHSSGWAEMLKYMRSSESLRVLDIGPTSSTNINFITGLGHSIYMANLVEEASRPEWMVAPSPGEPATFDVDRFLAANLNFSGRTFDAVIFWDTADYLPEALVAAMFARIYEAMQPGGRLLAFSHTKAAGGETAFFRYHLTETETVEMQPGGSYPLRQVFNNRQIENFLHAFSSFRFFLAKDNLREVLATR